MSRKTLLIVLFVSLAVPLVVPALKRLLARYVWLMG